MAYLDNNATTIMPESVLCAMRAGCNRGNPSASYASADGCKSLMTDFRELLKKHCGGSDHKIIWTSGASEANAMIVHSFIFAWRKLRGSDPDKFGSNVPHFVLSAIEHRSLLDCVESYAEAQLATYTLVYPRAGSAHINPEDVSQAITHNTCLVCVMHANNETGAVNDIRECQRVAHSAGVPFYSDCAQSLGKLKIIPVDAFCVSFHKCHGPPGIGAIFIRSQLLKGHQLQAMIYGTQNDGLRGGTENMPGICGAYQAVKMITADRVQHMVKLKSLLINKLGVYPLMTYSQYVERGDSPCVDTLCFILFVDNQHDYLPNTLLISAVNRKSPQLICNGDIKKALLAEKFIVSIGSACNTSSSKASHVLYAMRASSEIRRGTIRVSWCHETTPEQIANFSRVFLKILTTGVGRS